VRSIQYKLEPGRVTDLETKKTGRKASAKIKAGYRGTGWIFESEFAKNKKTILNYRIYGIIIQKRRAYKRHDDFRGQNQCW
jgi:hypothetical protein